MRKPGPRKRGLKKVVSRLLRNLPTSLFYSVRLADKHTGIARSAMHWMNLQPGSSNGDRAGGSTVCGMLSGVANFLDCCRRSAAIWNHMIWLHRCLRVMQRNASRHADWYCCLCDHIVIFKYVILTFKPPCSSRDLLVCRRQTFSPPARQCFALS